MKRLDWNLKYCSRINVLVISVTGWLRRVDRYRSRLSSCNSERERASDVFGARPLSILMFLPGMTLGRDFRPRVGEELLLDCCQRQTGGFQRVRGNKGTELRDQCEESPVWVWDAIPVEARRPRVRDAIPVEARRPRLRDAIPVEARRPRLRERSELRDAIPVVGSELREAIPVVESDPGGPRMIAIRETSLR